MITEYSEHTMQLTCDYHTGRNNRITVAQETRDKCIIVLYQLGWRLHRDKHICPRCLTRKAQEARNPHTTRII